VQHGAAPADARDGAGGEHRSGVIAGFRRRQVSDHARHGVLDRLERREVRRGRIERVEADEEPCHLVERRRQLGERELRRALHPLDDQ
jgi:hypothetical protein